MNRGGPTARRSRVSAVALSPSFALDGGDIAGVRIGGRRIAGGKRIFDGLVESSVPNGPFLLGCVLM